MYAVAFDLVVADTEKHHPKGVRRLTPKSAQCLPIMVFVVCKAACMLPTTRTWRTCSLPSKRCEPERGFRSRCGTFVPSGLNSGQTLLLW